VEVQCILVHCGVSRNEANHNLAESKNKLLSILYILFYFMKISLDTIVISYYYFLWYNKHYIFCKVNMIFLNMQALSR